jgi:predicted GTPase
MSKRSKATPYLRGLFLAIGLLLPSLTLLPFGSIWLWQHGYLLYWAIGTCLTVAATYAVQMRLLGQTPASDAPTPAQGAAAEIEDDKGDPSWTPAEAQAWRKVLQLAARVSPEQISSREAAIQLGLDTIRSVAETLHPQEREPLWKFTVPEALAILERVSGKLRTFVGESIPLGDRLTVAQMMALYRWRGTLELAERAYDLWRLARFINPLTAATHEVRERLTREMLQWGREHITRKLATTYVKEVGRAAIELYGGRLRVSDADLARHVSSASAADRAALAERVAEPLRVLVAGQVSAGKSSLINALAQEVHAAVDVLPTTASFAAYEIRHGDFPAALLIDSPGLGMRSQDIEPLIDKAAESDLMLWVVAAHRADRNVDRHALDAFRSHFAQRLNRRRPPVVLVVSQIDRLRPFQEWEPPYDLVRADRPKAVSIRDAVRTAASELGFIASEAVPVSTAPGQSAYNIDALWAEIVRVLPEALSAQLVRRLHDVNRWDWSRLWTQAVNAGRVIAGSLKR